MDSILSFSFFNLIAAVLVFLLYFLISKKIQEEVNDFFIKITKESDIKKQNFEKEKIELMSCLTVYETKNKKLLEQIKEKTNKMEEIPKKPFKNSIKIVKSNIKFDLNFLEKIKQYLLFDI